MNMIQVNSQVWGPVTELLNITDQLHTIPARKVDNGTHQLIHPQIRTQLWDHIWDEIWDSEVINREDD